MKKSCLLLLGVITLVIIGIATFFIVYKTNNPSESKILSEKFGFDITNEMKITYIEHYDGGTKAALLIRNDEYENLLSDMTQAGFWRFVDFEKTPEDIDELSLEVRTRYRHYLNNRDWIPIYNLSEEYRYIGRDKKTKKRIYSYAYFTDEVNGFRELYLVTNY